MGLLGAGRGILGLAIEYQRLLFKILLLVFFGYAGLVLNEQGQTFLALVMIIIIITLVAEKVR